MITASNLISLLPILIISITTIAVMLMIAIHRQHQITVWITACGLGVALISIIIPATAQLPQQVSPLLLIDQYSLFFTAIICSAGVALTFLSSAYFNEPIARHGFTLPANDKTDRGRYGAVDRLVAPGSVPGKSTSEHNVFYLDEYYALLTLSILGAVILVSSSHFASFFLGMEVLGIPLLAMIAYSVNNNHSIEAGVKYLVLTAFASAFLLFGMALIYAKTGTLNFAVLAFRLNTGTLTMNFYVISGVMLLITGVGIKLSLAPFHMWTPDVYQGAPTPVSAFLATVSKGAMFVVLMRYVLQTEVVRQTPVICWHYYRTISSACWPILPLPIWAIY
jgi:NADH-quinone oxidoreductase subunit N